MRKISTGYYPRQHQQWLHSNMKRFNVLVCHRRFGKTVFCINEMIDQAFRCTKKNPQYAYIGPTYGSVKRVAWDYFKEYTQNIPGVETNEAELRIDIPTQTGRVRFMLLGAENPGSLRGIYLDGVILDEYAECDPMIWNQVIRPALSDRLGWAIFIGTPKGMNHFHDVYQIAKRTDGWFHAMFKASETKIVPESELEAAKAVMSDEEYLQEFETSFAAALIGAYYGKEISKAEESNRISSVPYDSGFDVVTGWDLGMNDTTCIWFAQQIGREIHIIDYLESSGTALDYYVKQLKERDYVYSEHFLPHDAAARELGTGKSRQETLYNLGLRNMTIVPKQRIEDGINAARTMLGKCWFDLQRTARGVDALKNYQRKWDAKQKVFANAPLHNWASNGADAFRTLAMGFRSDDTRISKLELPREAEREYDIFKG